MVFNFTVRGDKITPDEEYLFTEGNKGSYEAVFDFGEEWDELTKLCIVRSGDKKYSIPIFGNCCLLPELSKSSAKIGAVGVDAVNEELVTRISTNMLGIGVQSGAYDEETAQELDTAAQVWEQYLTEMENNRKAAEAAKEGAKAACSDAVSAKEEALKYAGSAHSGAEAAGKSATDAKTSADNAATSEESAKTSANKATDAATDAQKKANSVLGMTADAVTLAEGSDATVEKTETDGVIHLHFAIPRGQTGKMGAKGDKGDKGDKGEKGDRGEKGIQGEQGPKGDTGAPGADGQDGADGYTPVRGKDYWTEEDKAEIKTYVDEAILGGAW